MEIQTKQKLSIFKKVFAFEKHPIKIEIVECYSFLKKYIDIL